MTKITKKKRRTRKRHYMSHKWMRTQLIQIQNRVKWRAEKQRKFYEDRKAEFEYLAQEYINGVISDEEYKKKTVAFKRMSSIYKYNITIWEERDKHLQDLIDEEEFYMAELKRQHIL